MTGTKGKGTYNTKIIQVLREKGPIIQKKIIVKNFTQNYLYSYLLW